MKLENGKKTRTRIKLNAKYRTNDSKTGKDVRRRSFELTATVFGPANAAILDEYVILTGQRNWS